MRILTISLMRKVTKSSDDNESGPENSNEDLLQNEDEYLVIENYVDGQVDEFFFWGKR